jgi:hypothetical protein
MPPRGKRAKSPEAKFLFVNEDASTVNRTSKDTELDRTKQSHVQRQNFARKRRLREQSDSLQQPSGQSSVSPPSSGAGPSTQEVIPENASYFDILQNIDLGEPWFQSTSPSSHPQTPLNTHLSALFSDPFTGTPPATAVETRMDHAYGSAHNYRPGHYFDTPPTGFPGHYRRSSGSTFGQQMSLSMVSSPPTTSTRALEQWAPPLIKHYNTIILPEQFWKDTRKATLAQFRHAPLIHADMQACMTEPAHLYSFLAAAAAHMVSREGRLLLPHVSLGDTWRVPAFFKSKAVQALRAKLAGGHLDHRLAVDTHRLYTATVYSDGLESAEPHLQALLSMVETLGGLSTFDEYQLETILILDCNLAVQQAGVPRLAVPLDAEPLPESILSEVAQAEPTAFQRGSQVRIISEAFEDFPDLPEIHSQLNRLVAVSAYLETSIDYDHSFYKWFSWQALVLLHRLLSIPLHEELSDRADSGRLATILWLTVMRSAVVGRRTASKTVPFLRAKLENTELVTLWQPHTDCLLWIAIIGGVCVLEEGEDLDWFVRLTRTSAAEIGINSAQELESWLTALLYDPPSQRDLVLAFAAKVWPPR